MKKIVIVIIGALIFNSVWAQQELMISQYTFDRSINNPAAAGSGEYFNITSMFRKQWVNLDASPTSGIINIEGPIQKMNFGTGLLIFHDRIGVTERSDIYGSYAYKLKMKGSSILSFGLRAGISLIQTQNSKHTYWDENDELLIQNANEAQPNFGFGVYYRIDALYAGVTIPYLLNYKPATFMSTKGVFQQERHYFITVGYNIKVEKNFSVEPSILAKYVANAPPQFHLNVTTVYDDLVGIGLGFRSGDAATANVIIQVSNRVRLGYAFDFTFTDIRNYSSGTHEVILSYSFGTKKGHKSLI